MARVVHVTTALSPSGAGVFEAVRGITTRLAAEGSFDVEVVGVAGDDDDPEEIARNWPGVMVRRVAGTGATGLVGLFREAMRAEPGSIDIVHAHGLWDGASLAGSILARRAGCPLVLAPHGMLEPWALKRSRMKKLLPWWLWEAGVVRRAAVLEAKSDLEASSIRSLGLNDRIAIIPVGLSVPARPPSAVDRPQQTVRTCLFLSRLHPKKGLDLLIRAWAAARPAGWKLVIAGPGPGEYVQGLRDLCRREGVEGGVEFRGPVAGDEKWSLMASADLFVLPSHSENFGIVVPEALAMGVPCIATTGTPWQDLPRLGLGWWVAPHLPDITRAIEEAAALSPEALREMGAGGPRYVAETFAWPAVTRRTLDLYASLLGGRAERAA